MWVNTEVAQTRSNESLSSGSGGSGSFWKQCSGGLRFALTHSMLGPSMSQPQNSASRASLRKWRSTRAEPHPKSSTRLP